MLSSTSSVSFFAFDRHATSLTDLDIVRRIVEREGCVEAFSHILTSAVTNSMVLHRLVDQLRHVSVQIVEMIQQWKGTHRQVFLWRNHNYLLKMTHDLDFLAPLVHRHPNKSIFLQSLQLEKNPFLCEWHLEHPCVVDKLDDFYTASSFYVGNVDGKRILSALRVLREECNANKQEMAFTQTNKLAMTPQTTSIVRQACAVAAVNEEPVEREELDHEEEEEEEQEEEDEMDPVQRDLQISRQLIQEMKQELAALREEIALLQSQLTTSLAPDQRRKVQTKIGNLMNELKSRSGALFHRKNELRRKETLALLPKRRLPGPSSPLTQPLHSSIHKPTAATTSLLPSAVVKALETAMQHDELRRQELIERLEALTPETKIQKPRPKVQVKFQSPGNLEDWTVDQVASFIDSLGLETNYGTTVFKPQGIDGGLLAQATDDDLAELGIAIRLHRVRILECIHNSIQ